MEDKDRSNINKPTINFSSKSQEFPKFNNLNEDTSRFINNQMPFRPNVWTAPSVPAAMSPPTQLASIAIPKISSPISQTSD